MEGGYNFAVEASEDSEVSLLLYKKRGAATPVEIVFPKDFHTGRVWALKLCSASLKEFEYNYKIDGAGSVCIRTSRERAFRSTLRSGKGGPLSLP